MLSHLYNLIKGRLLVNSSIEKRVVDEALYMIETKKTLREIAKVFKISKSTVHKDLKEKLKNIDNHLFMEVKLILDEHIKIRHTKIKAAQSSGCPAFRLSVFAAWRREIPSLIRRYKSCKFGMSANRRRCSSMTIASPRAAGPV